MNELHRQRFIDRLELEYTFLFQNDPEYKFSAERTTPKELAVKMTDGLIRGNANKDGAGVKRTCKALGVAYTYKGIQAYLSQEVK